MGENHFNSSSKFYARKETESNRAKSSGIQDLFLMQLNAEIKKRTDLYRQLKEFESFMADGSLGSDALIDYMYLAPIKTSQITDQNANEFDFDACDEWGINSQET